MVGRLHTRRHSGRPKALSSIRRDPPTPAEAKKIAKRMFDELRISKYGVWNTSAKEMHERAAVLADVLGYTDRP